MLKKKFLTIISLIIFSLTPVMPLSATVYADCGDSDTPAGQVRQGFGETGSSCNENGVQNAVRRIVTVLSWVAGVVAVIMIMISGFKYMTSGGDSGKIASAKSSLIYAMIGLAIAALALTITGFVVSSATKCNIPGKTHLDADSPACVKTP